MTDRVHQEKVLKACNEVIDFSEYFRFLSGHFGNEKMAAMVAVRLFFPPKFRCVTNIIKYCDMCQNINTYKLQEGNKTLHPIPIHLKVLIKNGTDFIGLLKEIESYKYIVEAILY